MKRTWRLLYPVMLLLIFFFPLTAYAHPGRTDENGGHTDHSTGEYHYHHGYSAHEHYDIDGDGIIDCPYDFDDKTSNNSSNNSGGVSPPKQSSNTKQPTNNKGLGNIKTDMEEETFVPTWTKWLLVILAITIAVLIMKLRKKNMEIDKQRKSFEEERLSNNDFIQSLVSDFEKATGRSILRTLAGVPEDDFVDENLLPFSKDDKAFKWGYKYTFYGSLTTSKYHRDGCRYCNSFMPLNAYTIHRGRVRYTPCQVCRPQLPDVSWVDRYIKYKLFFDKHNVKSD